MTSHPPGSAPEIAGVHGFPAIISYNYSKAAGNRRPSSNLESCLCFALWRISTETLTMEQSDGQTCDDLRGYDTFGNRQHLVVIALSALV